MPTRIQDIEQRLWRVGDEISAASKLLSQENAVLLLGFIFLRYSEHLFEESTETLQSGEDQGASQRRCGIDKES